MPSIKDLKKRISSVKNTQQTTKAMKMVSAAKLRRAQDAIQNHRPYARRIGDLIRLVTALGADETALSPILGRTAEVEGGGTRKVLVVVISSDRGLCGGFNSNVIKAAQRWIVKNQSSYAGVELAFVGRKGFDYFKPRKTPIRQHFSELGGKVTFPKAKVLADTLVDWFLRGEVDEIKIVYNEFKNAVTQTVVVEDFLPLPKTANESAGSEKAGPVEIPMYIVSPSLPEMMEELLAKTFSIQAFRVMLESQASEHGARMSAMENATKNAGEMIRKLTLQFNKQRQAGITKELLEIISGSESQKG